MSSRSAKHPRRRPEPADAIGDEPEDQVSGIVPSVCAIGPPRNASLTISSSTPTVRICSSSHPCRKSRRKPIAREHNDLWGIDLLNVPRSDIAAVTHLELIGVVPDRPLRTRIPDTMPCSKHLRRRRAAESSSTRRSTFAESRLSALPPTRTAASCVPKWMSLCLRTVCCTRLIRSRLKGIRTGRKNLS